MMEHACVELVALRTIVVLAIHVCTKPASTCYLCDGMHGGNLYKNGTLVTCSSCLYTNWHDVDEWDLID
jgi:hypothetical protein